MSLSLALAWLAAHPLESLALIGAVLSVVNGALPASVQRGPIGRVLHAVLDRLAVLSRSDAAGTLKWPGVASALLAPPPMLAADIPGHGYTSPDPVAPPLPTPAPPSPVLRAVTVSYRPAPPPSSDDGNAAAYELARREVAAARVFDPLARQTIAPDVVDAARRASDGQSGRVEFGAAGFLLVLFALVAVGLHAASCVPVRRLILDHTDGVPARGPCIPTVQRCAVLDGGVFLPVVCSADHREWPTHPLSADGEQTTCAVGEGCEVTDAGIARCTAADGGAR